MVSMFFKKEYIIKYVVPTTILAVIYYTAKNVIVANENILNVVKCI